MLSPTPDQGILTQTEAEDRIGEMKLREAQVQSSNP